MKTVVKIVIGVLLVLFAVVGALIVVMNFLPEQEGVVSTTAEVEAADPLAEEAPVVALDVGVTETENDVRVFNFTLEDFIASYNGYYWQDEGVRYLLAAEDWPQENLEQTVQSAEPATRYYYRADAEKWTLPQLRVTVPEGSDKGIDSFDALAEHLKAQDILFCMGNSDVPVGQYTQKILAYYDLDEAALAAAGVITYGSNVKEVTTQVSEASVDAGVVYCTDAYSAGLTPVDEATKEMCGQVIYPAAVMKNALHAEAAKEFLAYLRTDKAATVFESVGFTAL